MSGRNRRDEYGIKQRIPGKEMLLADDVEDREFLCKLLEAMYDELPAPKKKK